MATQISRELISLDNPRYKQSLDKYEKITGVEMDDLDIGAGDYARIKTETVPRIGAWNEPMAEKTKLEWTIISPGKEVDLTPMFMTQTSSLDYETLCRLDIRGLVRVQGTVETALREVVRDRASMKREPPIPHKQ